MESGQGQQEEWTVESHSVFSWLALATGWPEMGVWVGLWLSRQKWSISTFVAHVMKGHCIPIWALMGSFRVHHSCVSPIKEPSEALNSKEWSWSPNTQKTEPTNVNGQQVSNGQTSIRLCYQALGLPGPGTSAADKQQERNLESP